MSEEQLRDILARVVPEAPDSVADPAPVVRAARVRRRVQVGVVAGAVAVVAVAGVLGGRALTDDDAAPQVVDKPSASVDPYAAVLCPDQLPANGALPDDVVAVRYCGLPLNGFPAAPGAPDALVEGVDDFIDEAGRLPAANPGRCAAIDYVSTDSRLLLQRADGSLASVSAGFCQDVIIGDRSVDATTLAEAFLSALDGQRDAFAYTSAGVDQIDCQEPPTYGPARPERESLVAATWCSVEGIGEVLGKPALALVADGWQRATVRDDRPSEDLDPCLGDEMPYVLARTDRGDLIRLSASPCDYLAYNSWETGVIYQVPVDMEALSAS